MPSAIYSEIPGDDHFVTDVETQDFIAEIERFTTASLRYPEPDRALATVMFMHIVESIERAATMSIDGVSC